MERKNIVIADRHERFLKEEPLACWLNLLGFVRRELDHLMESQEKADK